MESLGITQIPIVSKRRKQQFHDLQIDTNGIISIEDKIEDDVDFTTAGEDHLLIDVMKISLIMRLTWWNQ